MYSVIFTAKPYKDRKEEQYSNNANRLREIAFSDYNCQNFVSYETKEDTEITISYWDSLEDIKNWKNNLEHLEAQKQGKNNYYEWYTVEVNQIMRSYKNNIMEE